MCGRFTQHYTWAEVHAFLSVLGPPRNLQPRYNIAPTTTVDVIRLDQDGRRELVPMRWGLVPGWWKKTLKGLPVQRGEWPLLLAWSAGPSHFGGFKLRSFLIQSTTCDGS